jgi:hypothetical protein
MQTHNTIFDHGAIGFVQSKAITFSTLNTHATLHILPVVRS